MTDLRIHIEKLASDDEADRIYAAEDIGYANQAEGIPPLFARLRVEHSRAVREAIFDALLQVKDDAVIEGALRLLDSEDSFLRNHAVEILQARGSQAVPFLRVAFRGGSNDRRKFVIDILARLTDPATSDIYEEALRDPDLNVVITAIESLGATRRPGFRQKVEDLITPNGHPMLLCAAIEALAQIGDGETASKVRGQLGSVAAMPGYLQWSFLKLLGAKGGTQDVGEVASLIGRQGLEGHVLNALTALHTRIGHLVLPETLSEPLQKLAQTAASPLDSYRAVRLLGALLYREEVFEFVQGCLGHSEKAIRVAAVQALRESGTERAQTSLSDRLGSETDDEVLQVLRR